MQAELVAAAAHIDVLSARLAAAEAEAAYAEAYVAQAMEESALAQAEVDAMRDELTRWEHIILEKTRKAVEGVVKVMEELPVTSVAFLNDEICGKWYQPQKSASLPERQQAWS